MCPTFDIAVEWAPETHGQRMVTVEGRTVGECLAVLLDAYPGLKGRLAYPARHELFVNWKNIRLANGLDTTIEETDIVQLLPGRS